MSQFNARDFGAPDDPATLQAALNAANAAGGSLYIPAGAYTFNVGLTVDNSGKPGLPNVPTGLVSVFGDGPGSTVLLPAAGTLGGAPGLSVIGPAQATSMQTFRDFSIMKSDGQGIGLFFQNHAHVKLDNVWVSGWDRGIFYRDVQESIQINVNAQFNVAGFHCEKQSVSAPNALSFFNCTYANNKQCGIDAYDVTTFLYVGGSIEGNSDSFGGSYTPTWGCRLIATTAGINEGKACGTFLGVYFERNGSATPGKGQADLWYDNAFKEGTLVVQGCNFNREATFGTNQITIGTANGFRHKIVLSGNAHHAPPGGAYPGPSASRPYIGVPNGGQPVSVIGVDDNFYESSIEAPTVSQVYDWTTGSQQMLKGVVSAIAAGTLHSGMTMAQAKAAVVAKM